MPLLYLGSQRSDEEGIDRWVIGGAFGILFLFLLKAQFMVALYCRSANSQQGWNNFCPPTRCWPVIPARLRGCTAADACTSPGHTHLVQTIMTFTMAHWCGRFVSVQFRSVALTLGSTGCGVTPALLVWGSLVSTKQYVGAQLVQTRFHFV